MHYLVDGYNILFRRKLKEGSFEEVREKLIKELDILARALNLQMTIVLDAYKKKEELQRHHFRSLEVVYTDYGQTADACIIDYILHQPEKMRKKIVVITSDGELQRKAHLEKATFLSVSSFFYSLEKKILKKYPPSRNFLQKESTSNKGKKELPSLMDTTAWIALFERRPI
jgi:predicted RNA-binding protein with PIN domain